MSYLPNTTLGQSSIGGRSQGKVLTMVAFVQFALTKHKTVFVMTNDLVGSLERLRRVLPNNLIEICDGGLRVHR